MKGSPAFDPHSYWENRFEKGLDLSATGYIGMGEAYNQWLYRGFQNGLRQLLAANKLVLSKSTRVIDAGAGAGFMEAFCQDHGVAGLTGLDFTASSVEYLQKQYPNYQFHVHDLTQPLFREMPPADFTFCIAVLYHIVTKEGFSQALENLARATKPGGYVILADNFFPRPQPYLKGIHQRDWSLPEFEREFARLNLHPISFQPVFFFLNAPVRFSDRCLGRTTLKGWRWIQQQLAGREKVIKGVAPLAYYLDAGLRKLCRRGPGIHYLLLRKENSFAELNDSPP